jgi:hypothetical protein
MSLSSPSRRILHLAVGAFPLSRLEEIRKVSDAAGDTTGIFVLTETNASEALEKIFSADSIAVWAE